MSINIELEAMLDEAEDESKRPVFPRANPDDIEAIKRNLEEGEASIA